MSFFSALAGVLAAPLEQHPDFAAFEQLDFVAACSVVPFASAVQHSFAQSEAHFFFFLSFFLSVSTTVTVSVVSAKVPEAIAVPPMKAKSERAISVFFIVINGI